MFRDSVFSLISTVVRLTTGLILFIVLAHVWGPERFGTFMYPFTIAGILVKVVDYGFLLQVTRDVEWPDLPWGPAVGAIVTAEGASAFLELIDSGDVTKLRCPACRTGGYSALLLPAVDYVHAMRGRRPMRAPAAPRRRSRRR